MRPLLIIIGLEAVELALEVNGIPKEYLIKVFPTYAADQPFDKWM